MTERIPFQTFGPSAFKPEAGHYWMLPDELAGKIGKRTMIVLRAILKALAINGALQTETWATRQDIINLIPEEQRPKTKRSITGCYANLVELGVFPKRERIPGTNTWPIKLLMALRAQFDDDSAPPAADPRSAQPDAPTKPLTESTVESLIQICWGYGWRVVSINGERAELLALEGKPQTDLAADHQELFDRHNKQIAAYHKVRRVQRE
jgi:hypothetical protein